MDGFIVTVKIISHLFSRGIHHDPIFKELSKEVGISLMIVYEFQRVGF